MTWTQLVTHLLGILGARTAANHWDSTAGDPNLTALVKAGEIEFNSVSGWYRGNHADNIIADEPEYAIPADCLQIGDVYAGGEELDQTNIGQLRELYGADWTTETGTPWGYLHQGESIRLVPIPTDAETNGLKWEDYIKEPLQSTSSPVITSSRWQWAFIHYAASIAKEEDRGSDDNEKKYHYGQFMGICMEAKKARKSKVKKDEMRDPLREDLNDYWDHVQ